MARYVALIDGEAGAYGASFPDAPGCVAMAATIDEVVRDAGEVLAEWVADRLAEGHGAPAARTPEALRADPEVAEAIREGATMALVPLVFDSGRPARANLSIDAGLLASIDEEAAREGVTRSAFIASAARARLLGTYRRAGPVVTYDPGQVVSFIGAQESDYWSKKLMEAISRLEEGTVVSGRGRYEKRSTSPTKRTTVKF